jgi:hypothetical protein
MPAKTSRKSASAEASAISRKPAGSNSATFSANAATRSTGANLENMLGSIAATNSAAGAWTPPGSSASAPRRCRNETSPPSPHKRWPK